jgi:hypothetical protein
MRRNPFAGRFYVIAALSMLPLGMAAQRLQAQAPDADTRDEARVLFNRGVEQYQAERYREALASFQEAYRLAPHPLVRVNMANCYDKLNKPLEAIFHFEQFLDEMGTTAPAQQRREVKEALNRLRKQVGELNLDVAPDGALVRIDDTHERRSPVIEPVLLPQGTHQVEITHPGFVTARRDVDIPGGGSTSLFVRLDKEAAPPAVAVAPPPETAPGHERATEPAPSEPASERPLAASEYTAPPTPHGAGSGGLTTPTIIAGVVTGALVVAATVTGILALRNQSDFEDYRRDAHNPELPACRTGNVQTCVDQQNQAWADAHNAGNRATSLARATNVLIIGAAVGAVTTGALFLVGQQHGNRRDVALAPRVGPHEAGVSLAGQF